MCFFFCVTRMLELSRTTRKNFGKETYWIAATERQGRKSDFNIQLPMSSGGEIWSGFGKIKEAWENQKWQAKLKFQILLPEKFVIKVAWQQKLPLIDARWNRRRKFWKTADVIWGLSNVYWTVHRCNSWRMKDQLDITCYFISLLMCSTCFGH